MRQRLTSSRQASGRAGIVATWLAGVAWVNEGRRPGEALPYLSRFGVGFAMVHAIVWPLYAIGIKFDLMPRASGAHIWPALWPIIAVALPVQFGSMYACEAMRRQVLGALPIYEQLKGRAAVIARIWIFTSLFTLVAGGVGLALLITWYKPS